MRGRGSRAPPPAAGRLRRFNAAAALRRDLRHRRPHEYKGERSVFYDELDGVVLVHDLTFRGSAKKLERWAREIAATGTFAPAASTPQWNAAPGTPLAMPPSSSNVLHGFGGLPVPALVVANKADYTRDEETTNQTTAAERAARDAEDDGSRPSAATRTRSRATGS